MITNQEFLTVPPYHSGTELESDESLYVGMLDRLGFC